MFGHQYTAPQDRIGEKAHGGTMLWYCASKNRAWLCWIECVPPESRLVRGRRPTSFPVPHPSQGNVRNMANIFYDVLANKSSVEGD